jgi:GT2 family glycosyltransferase
MEIAVCVASHRRPESLFTLLGALDAQTFDELDGPEPSLRIVVADNDPERSAEPVCRDAQRWLRHPLHYVHEKRQGIPMARNAAVAAAWESPWIAFVDDDEVPTPGWLAALLRAQREQQADVVAGPVVPVFDFDPPGWLARGGFLEYAPSGPHSARTGNLLVRRDCLAGQPILFDERMVPIGEDRELFERVASAGARIVWASDAEVRETVPPERATLRFVLERAFRAGIATSRIAILRRSRRGAVPRAVAHGLWCGLRGAVEVALAPLRGAETAVAGLRLLVFGWGRWRGLAGLPAAPVSLPDRAFRPPSA